MSIINWFSEQLSTNQFASGAAIGTAFASAIYSLKSVPMFLWKRFIRIFTYEVTLYERDPLFNEVQLFIRSNYGKKFKFVEAGVQNDTLNIKPTTDYFFIKVKGWPVKFSSTKEKFENTIESENFFFSVIKVSTLFRKKIINNLLTDLHEKIKEEKLSQKKSFLYVPSWHGWRVQKEIYKKLNSVVLKDNLQEEIRKDLQEFKNSRERYDYLNIPYNRGYLFYGPPGNGKTSISTALSSEFGMDLYYFNLSSMHDKEAIQIFNEIGGNTIILFEDIDSFYKGRECTEATKVSFSTLLNLIDGTLSKEGCIVIITTNHIEKLDPALIRTGRIHKKYYIDNPDTHQIESYLNKFFNQKIEIGKLIEQVSMSDVVNHCIETNDVSEVLHRISK